jgi:hypothetical protein
MTVKAKSAECTVTRERTDSDNTYRVGKEEYRAFGSAVPDGVRSVLRLDELNFQMQHDAPFWFGLSSAEVGRQLNSIVDLESIDHANTWLTARARQLRSSYDVVSDRLSKAKAEAERLGFVDEMASELQAVRDLEAFGMDANRRWEELDGVVEYLNESSDKVSRLQGCVVAAEVVSGKAGALVSARRAFEELELFLRDMDRLQLQAEQEIPDMTELEALYKSQGDASAQCVGLDALIESVEAQDVKILRCAREISKQEEFIRKETQGRCPLCGGKMDV